MTRVIHTGDTHIGYQQYNAPERRRDFVRAFRRVVEDAVEDDVDAVIHAGDLFHDRRPGLVDLQNTIEILRTLERADVPFLAVVGNHESKRDAQWLDLFEDLGLATRLGSEPFLLEDVAVYGLDFVPRSRRDDLEYDFAPLPEGAERAALVGHGLFEPFAHADWDTARVLEEATVDFDAVLLGDNHEADTAEVCDAWVTYCGSTERTSASEREPRGYNVVTFDDEVAITRRGLEATREFVFVDVTLEGEEGIDRVQERVRQHDLEDAVVIVTIEGEGVPVTPAAIEEFARDRGALVARVNDRREIETDEEVSVSFADPDEAVRERIRDLGLSDAALEIDETVRDDAVADANVRETVERRIRELLEDDRAALESAADGGGAGSDDGAGAAGEAATGGSETNTVSGAIDGDAGHTASGDGPDDGGDGPNDGGDGPDDGGDGPNDGGDGPDDGGDEPDDDAPAGPGDEQVSMGDFA